jgi:DNA-binding protein HU-beta
MIYKHRSYSVGEAQFEKRIVDGKNDAFRQNCLLTTTKFCIHYEILRHYLSKLADKEHCFTMKKSDFVDALAGKLGVSKEKANENLNAMLDLIQETLKGLPEKEKLTLTGFGTFEVRTRAARKGVNIRTGKPIDIPAGKRPVFTAGAVLKEAITGEKKETTRKSAPKKDGAAKKPAAKKPAPKKK